MDFLKFLVVFSVVVRMVESKSVPDRGFSEMNNKPTVLKLPMVLHEEMTIVILGETTNIKSFSVMITEESGSSEWCEIIFRPTDGTIITKNNTMNSTTNYDFYVPKPANVFFELHMIGQIDKDFFPEHAERVTGFVVNFEANKAGPATDVTPCVFSSLRNLRYIILEGVQQVKTLSFNFTKPFETNR